MAASQHNYGPNLPLLKWPGGKRLLVTSLLPLIPTRYGTYFEPFAGGAALFFALGPARSILSDTNEELITCYKQVRDNPDQVIQLLASMPNAEESYYRIRSAQPADPVGIAARLIYLATLSFNGIHRVNLRGEFNVPYGHKRHINPCDPDKIYAASRRLANSTLVRGDFEDVVSRATSGDVIYFDPPYTVAHANNGFVKYNQTLFSWSDQVRLSQLADELDLRGCRVIISNADHESVRQLYPQFNEIRIARPSRISASAKYRRSITESVYHNWSGE